MSGFRRRARTLLAAIAVSLIGAVLLVGSPATAAVARDSLSVSGYDYQSERSADVIAGSTANDLVFRYVAATSLTDGTMTIGVPTADWPTPLSSRLGFSGDSSEDGGGVA